MYKVLIVDDESFIRRGLEHCMDWGEYGCELVDTASDGLDALEKIHRLEPDIVISDINMDRMTGIELVERLNAGYPHIKCILLTGICEFNNVYSAIKYNVMDLILKPTSPSRIQQAISKAINEIQAEERDKGLHEQIDSQNEQNQRLKHAMMLSNIVDGHTPAEEVAEALEHVCLYLHNYCIVTVLLWGISEKNASSTFYQVEKMVYSYTDQLFEDVPYYCGFTNGHSIHFVIDYPEIPNDFTGLIRHLCIDLYKTIDNLTDYNSSIGIGDCHRKASELLYAAKESVKAANYALYDKEAIPVVMVKDMPPISNDTIVGIKQHVDALSDALESADLARADTALETLKEYYAGQKLPIDEVRNIWAVVANLCIRNLWDHDLLDNDIFSTNHELYKGIMECGHLEDLYELSAKVVELTIRGMMETANEPKNLIEHVENHIKKHYQSDLSLTKIADKYHISSSYLSRLFKSKKNISLSTYIQNVRVEKAKELIIGTDLRTYEIAEQVGITDPVYFSKLFKKVTGIRVRDFRGADSV